MSGFRFNFNRGYNDGYNDGFDESQGGFGDMGGGFGDMGGGFGDMGGGYDDEFGDEPMFGFNNPPMFNRQGKARYDMAYGNYQGGYGPGGGYGPRPLMPPPMPPPPPPGPRGPPGPPGSMWGRGFGPRGPPRKNLNDFKAVKYLMKCGITKENLKNLPHDLLALIQPEHCGLCDTEFDTFNISRMHYISKNHLKSQKKWLAKSNEVYQSELPLKSRSLYCELCDIQITSKVHGEAHYSGKQHRGIVDGRKKPKNPLLLQQHMQHRFEQLVRREKRCLKATDGKTLAEEEVSELPKTSSELYCEICKTTVTCSEQMTMHMNGKKHLSKEKQHILNVMKGKGKTSAGNAMEDEDNEDGDEDEEDEAEEGTGTLRGGDKEKEAQADDGEDWGNEAWDSTTTENI